MANKHRRLERLGEVKLNKQGCLMKIVEYNSYGDVIVEFQDKYKARVHTSYQCFLSGGIKNPYYPSVFNVGIIGNKYKTNVNNKNIKEYQIWSNMLQRCFDKKFKEKYPTYSQSFCCDDWLLYENFYEWIHDQSNFDKWLNGEEWGLDKDILVKGNKTYSSETCCLVPKNINVLFTKRDSCRGNLPIGVSYYKKRNKYCAHVHKWENGKSKRKTLGYYDTPEQAFKAYKNEKECCIKQISQEEYDKGNITKRCYEAMLNYKVEITD